MSELGYNMEYIKRLYLADKYVMREHMLEKMGERMISLSEILQALSDGEIIEEYHSDKPFPSCLIIGFTKAIRPIHIVCSVDVTSDLLYLITTYEPNNMKWSPDFKKRKKEDKL